MYTNAEFTQLDLIQSPVFVLEVLPDGMPVYVAFNNFGLALAEQPLSDFIGRTAKEVYRGAFGKTSQTRHLQVAQSGKPLTYELTLPQSG